MKNKYIFLIGFIIIITLACEPKEPTTPDNPLNGKTTAIFNPDKNYGTMTDIDGNIYKTIEIGDQVWMAENLRTTRYQNGDTLPDIADTAQWARLESGAYCNYNNTEDLDAIATYGRLYNWYAVVDERNIAPPGWHVASAPEWNTLFNYLGGDAASANKLKEAGDVHWADPFESDNSSGFTALPGGFRLHTRATEHIGFYGAWWTSTELNMTYAARLLLHYFDPKVNKDFNFKQNGYSIRCIKD